MPLFTTDRYWRKHGVTVQATLVEVSEPSRVGGRGGTFVQHVIADVVDPDGNLVRAKGELFSRAAHAAGQTVRVRFDPKHKEIISYDSSTVPKDEWLRDHNAAAAPVQVIESSAGLGEDVAARLDELETLKRRGLVDEQEYAEHRQRILGSI